MACRASRSGNTIETGKYVGPDYADERNVERVGKAMLWMTIQRDAIPKKLLQCILQSIAQRMDASHRFQIHGERTGCAESDCEQRAFGARAPAMFMPRAMDQRFELYTTPDIKPANTLGRIKLMAGDGQEIDVERIDF